MADDRVLQFAPMLRFSRHETHFPIDPALFVTRARLRRLGWCSASFDGYWNSAKRSWDSASPSNPPPLAALNPDLGAACAAMQAEAPSQPGSRRNRRPNDACNLWSGQRSGYALELTQAFARELRGVPGSAPFLVYDRYRREGPSGCWDVITYWFFYALNPHLVAHEGDWEPVTIVVDEAGKAAVRTDSRAGSSLQSLDSIERVEGTHPVIHVEAGSHRASTEPDDGDISGSIVLRSWRLSAQNLPDMPWSCYDGAWGRVGATEPTTGPLGPMFRRVANAAPSLAMAG